MAYLREEDKYPRFKDYKVYHPELISLAVEKCMEIISFLADEPNKNMSSVLNVLVR